MLSIKVDIKHIFNLLQMDLKKSQCQLLSQKICGLLLEKYFKIEKCHFGLQCNFDIANGNNMEHILDLVL